MDDLISRQAAIDAMNTWDWQELYLPVHFKQLLDDVPSVDAVEVVRCKDCIYFELNHWANVNGQPLIVAHEICAAWGGGCKTIPDGYCKMGERKEDGGICL